MYFIAPEELQMPDNYIEELKDKKIPYVIEKDLMKVVPELDIIYMTRVQKERFLDQEEYNKLKGVYQIDKTILNHTKKDVIIMHPLPRVDEINSDLDEFKQAAYFRQAGYGIPVRQALIALVTGMIQN